MSAEISHAIRLSEFLPNPKTQDANEWIEIANDADTQADLSGWAVDDADGGGSPYRLPQGSSIAPHSLLVIMLPKALFNNGGDTVRLLRPDGGVADQYVYAQSSADRSFCRAESGWKLCDPSPNAPNHAATLPGTPVDQPPTLATQALDLAASDAPSLHQQSIVSDSSQQLRLPAWSQGAITAAPSYANATSGALYHGVARATPIPSFSTPTHALPAPQRQDAPPAVRPTALPLGMGAGIFLFVAGGAISGYNWLRSRRMPWSHVPAHDEVSDELDADLLEDDQDL
jgi:hypothetical protein